MKREKLVSVRDRVAELVAQYGGYEKAAAQLRISSAGFLHNLGSGRIKSGPRSRRMLGLKEPVLFERV